MNTNSNVYTVIYTTVIVVVVAAVLAFAAMKLKPMQSANQKAATISQIMMAANVGTAEEMASLSNDEILAKYSENISEAFVVDLAGDKVGTLDTAKESIELIDNLKAQNVAIKSSANVTLPVYVFNNGATIFPVYGAGLWGPIWGYIAVESDLRTISGVYFDHASETPGLGSKIKDEPWFKEQFVGKVFDLENMPFAIVKGGAPEGASNMVDAITGATMTSKGLDESIKTWVEAYKAFLTNIEEETSNE